MNRTDALVIGAGVAGLAVAAYLVRAGKNVTVLEAAVSPVEPAGAQDALDPQLVTELSLIGHGLRFAHRDLPLVAMGENSLTLVRDNHAAARAIAAVNDADAKAFVPFRRELYAQARRMRRFWWSALAQGTPHWVLEDRKDRQAFDRLCLAGADAWLGARFQSDALVSALLWDAVRGGFAPSEPGSALALMWCASGEMAGLQAAAALSEPGTLMASLTGAARGATLCLYAKVARILAAEGSVRGVTLEDGETIEAPLVLSSLCRDATDRLLGRSPAPGPRMGQARLFFTLSEPLALAPARYQIAEHSEIYLRAHEEARAGDIPSELPLEYVPVGPHHLAVTLCPFPASPPPGWRAQAAAQAVFAISRHVPGLGRNIANVEFKLSVRNPSLAQLLAPAGARIPSGLKGLYFCGSDAEPVPALSGRAARIAAAFALNGLTEDQK